MEHIKIQIVKGYEAPTKKIIPKKGDRDEIVIFEQQAYMHKGGAFPEPFQIGHKELTDSMEVGMYGICPSSFVTDNFGKLVLSKYDVRFIKID